jgi:hypothetical protein
VVALALKLTVSLGCLGVVLAVVLLLRATPGLEDIWQDHYSAAGTKDTNPPDDYIASLEPITGN